MNLGDAAAIDRIGLVRARRDRLVVAGARPREVLLVHVQVRQLFVVADRRILQNDCLELSGALAPSHGVERLPEQAEVRHDLHRDVDERADGTEEDDDPEPDRVRPAADEVDERHRLQDQAPRKQEGEKSHGRRDGSIAGPARGRADCAHAR
jgi:hypothetical protein